jgi:5-methylcytosine-specific restriction endonuclease McrA
MVKASKICSTCKIEKPLLDFYSDKSRPDGLCYICKDCTKIKGKKDRNKHAAKIRDRGRRYREANKEILKAKRHEYYERNKAKTLQTNRKWREANLTKIKRQQHKYRQANKARISKKNKVHYEQNKEYYKVHHRKHYRQNKDKRRQQQRAYYLNNKQVFRESEKRREAATIINGGYHTLEQWERLLAFYKGQCLVCGTTQNITKDHIIPISKGGSNSIDNLQPLCKAHNSSKWTKTIDYRPSIPCWLESDEVS